MIDKALLLLKEELSSYISSKGDGAATVIIDNIGLFETSNGTSLNDNIVITLVNIEEESALKNQAAIRRFPPRNAVYENSPTFLNLYVLISCNYSGHVEGDNSKGYIQALIRLSLVIQFLQGKSSLSYSSSVVAGDLTTGFDSSMQELMDLKFTMELYTLTFEQINHLWGSLGGRQVPFAMYKLRLVGITDRKPLREAPLIEEIDTTVIKISQKN